MPKWRRTFEAGRQIAGRREAVVDDTFVCDIVERIMKSGSDATQLLSAAKVVIERGPCKNFAIDHRRRADVMLRMNLHHHRRDSTMIFLNC